MTHTTTSTRSCTGTATPWDQARVLAHRLGSDAPLAVDPLPLGRAHGRTLAEPVHAATMLPGFDNAAMDGYAVHGPSPWQLVGRVLAGASSTQRLAAGQAVEIATGAPVPAGADRVVEYEVTTRRGDIVSAGPGRRDHIRRRGEYATTGQPILAAGRLLTPAALGLAASVGIDTVTVRRHPTARILITGDEVTHRGTPPPGKVRDAIGPVLLALLQDWHVTAPCNQVADRPSGALTTALDEALSDTDVTLVCGSSSVGPADGLHTALTDVGAVLRIDGVACRPGHPQLLAHRGDHWLIGIPGNPYAALVAALTLLQPLLTGMAGRALPALPAALLHGTVRPTGDATRLLPVRLRGQQAHVIDGAHPGFLGPAAHADAIAVIPPGWRGDPVELLPAAG